MFYNHNSNLNKWFVSPYLTISKETRIFFLEKKSKKKEDGHDNEKNLNFFLKNQQQKKNQMGWNIKLVGSMTKPTKITCMQQRLISPHNCAA